MASRQSVSSILKPSKVRAPLKEIEPIDQEDDEITATVPKRKVSFSGTNKIKMYNTGATSLTVHQAPMFDEQFSILSDSFNTEKIKLSGKFEKSDGQITFESTNCTNVESNGRVIIEYESPIDNMEMTEALPGKIFSDTIYTIDNDSEHFNDNSNDSENNMEFTEAIKVGTILTTAIESDIDETLNNEHEEQPETKFDFQPSTPIPDLFAINTCNISSYSSNMDLTCATKKSYTMDLICATERQVLEGNGELTYENSSQHSFNTEPEVSYEIKDNSDSKSQIIQNDILYTKTMEINNCSNHQTIDCGFKNPYDDDVVEQLSLSVVSMDIDPTLEGIEYDGNYVNVDNSKLLLNEKNNLIVPITTGKQNYRYQEEHVQDNYSNKIDINLQNNTPGISTGVSFVLDKSPEKNMNKSVTVEEQLQENTLHAHTSMPEQKSFEKDPSISIKETLKKKYSRKTMIHTASLVVENEDISDIQSDMSLVVEENQQNKYSRKSIAFVSGFSQIQPSGNEAISDTSMYGHIQYLEKDDATDTFAMAKENQRKKYSRKSMGPTSIFTQNEYSEDSVSNTYLSSEGSNEAPLFVNSLSLMSDNGNTQQLDVSTHNEEQLVLKSEPQSVLFNVINADDFNSPFRKKSKKSMVPTHLTKLVEHTNTLINEVKENESDIINEDDISENLKSVSEMDISVKFESNNENVANFSSKEISMTLSSSLSNEISFIKELHDASVNENDNSSSLINYSLKQKLKDISQSLNKENKYEKNKGKIDMITNEFKNNEINLNELVDSNELLEESDGEIKEETNNELIKVTDNTSKINHVSDLINCSSRCTDKISNQLYIEEDMSNMSISDETRQLVKKSFREHRKRSYSNINCAPLSCSSFRFQVDMLNCMNDDFTKDNFIKESPIKKYIIKEDLINDKSVMENAIEVNLVKEEQLIEEHLSCAVLEFLTRWNDKFVEKKLVLQKCTDSEWIFNVLDNNIILLISYTPIFNENSFLKVENISFITNTTSAQNEIITFGINWILSKYNPKVYKQICFTSRDVELLLKSLLEDVQFISMVMKNLIIVRSLYCVTFKDNKAQFVLHSMKHLLMARIEILLSNIHKISIKDVTVNCLFGIFNTNILDEIMENVTRDHNVVQSIVEKLIKFTCTRSVTSI